MLEYLFGTRSGSLGVEGALDAKASANRFCVKNQSKEKKVRFTVARHVFLGVLGTVADVAVVGLELGYVRRLETRTSCSYYSRMSN